MPALRFALLRQPIFRTQLAHLTNLPKNFRFLHHRIFNAWWSYRGWHGSNEGRFEEQCMHQMPSSTSLYTITYKSFSVTGPPWSLYVTDTRADIIDQHKLIGWSSSWQQQQEQLDVMKWQNIYGILSMYQRLRHPCIKNPRCPIFVTMSHFALDDSELSLFHKNVHFIKVMLY